MIWLLLWFVCFPFLSLQKHPRWWWRRSLLPFSGIPGLCNVTRADLWTNKFYTDLFFFPLTILFATYRIALLLHWWEILLKFCCSLHILHLVAKALIGTIVAKHLFNCAQLCNCAHLAQKRYFRAHLPNVRRRAAAAAQIMKSDLLVRPKVPWYRLILGSGIKVDSW